MRAENYTVRLNTGMKNPLLGMSYIQFAMDGLRHQLSQGAGGWSVEPGDRYAFYKLVDSVLPPATDKDGHEKDFFDGIDTSLQGLSSGFDAAGAKELARIESNLSQAAASAEKDPGSAAAPLLSVIDSLVRLDNQVRSGDQKQGLLMRLREKERQARTALNLALNLTLEASLVSPPGSTAPPAPGDDPLAAISPSQKFTVRVKLHNGSTHPVQLRSLFLEGQVNDSAARQHVPPLRPGQDYQTDFSWICLRTRHPPDPPCTATTRSATASIPCSSLNTRRCRFPPHRFESVPTTTSPTSPLALMVAHLVPQVIPRTSA